jgi:hypothetical protein
MTNPAGLVRFGWRASKVDLDHCGQVAGPNQGQQHRHRRGLQVGKVPARWVVGAELSVQIDQQACPCFKEPITDEPTIRPER